MIVLFESLYVDTVCVWCRVFHIDLQARLQQWGAEQCVGDVFVKLCSKLRVYTNYLNNYPTALHTIDKVKSNNMFLPIMLTS